MPEPRSINAHKRPLRLIPFPTLGFLDALSGADDRQYDNPLKPFCLKRDGCVSAFGMQLGEPGAKTSRPNRPLASLAALDFPGRLLAVIRNARSDAQNSVQPIP